MQVNLRINAIEFQRYEIVIGTKYGRGDGQTGKLSYIPLRSPTEKITLRSAHEPHVNIRLEHGIHMD